MPLFTFILEYEGGTYISQRRAENIGTALSLWVKAIVLEDLAAEASSEVAQAFQDLEGNRPVAVADLSNVWCVTSLNDSGLALLNIIQTES